MVKSDYKGSYQATGGLANTLGEIRQSSEGVKSDSSHYKNLLGELNQSNFLRSMKELRESIIE